MPTSNRKSSSSSSRTAASSKTTTDHEEIRQWAESRGATPACVRGTGGKGDTGLLRLDFPGYTGADTLQPITWDEWFEKFDDQNLALLYQEKTARGQTSNFNKLVSRETAAKTRSRTKSGNGRQGRGGRASTSASKKSSPSRTSGSRAQKSRAGAKGGRASNRKGAKSR